MKLTDSDKERFLLKVAVSSKEKCWNWTACLSARGYGRFQLNGNTYAAHRVSFVLHGGILEKDKEIDHKCRNKSCVNPDHLQQITHKENVLIGESLQAKNKRKTHCIRGHEFKDSTTYYRPDDGGRTCNICRMLNYHHKKKG